MKLLLDCQTLTAALNFLDQYKYTCWTNNRIAMDWETIMLTWRYCKHFKGNLSVDFPQNVFLSVCHQTKSTALTDVTTLGASLKCSRAIKSMSSCNLHLYIKSDFSTNISDISHVFPPIPHKYIDDTLKACVSSTKALRIESSKSFLKWSPW